MNEDQEVIIVEAPVETEVPVEEVAVEVEPEPVAEAAATPNARDVAYQYLRDNPEEMQSLARVAQRMTQQEPEALKAPDPDDFGTWEEYFRANNEYTQKAINAAVSEAVGGITRQYEPIVGTQAVTMAVDQIASKFGVPEEAKGFIAENLRGLSPQVIAGLDDGARRILALAAKGEALERGAMPTGRTNGKNIPAAEPVAGIGPIEWQCAPGHTIGEIEAYLKMTNQPKNAATHAKLKREGYLK